MTSAGEDEDPDTYVERLERRVGEAEAAIRGTQRQLRKEREARKAAEEELEIARPELGARQRELAEHEALRVQLGRLSAELERLAPVEAGRGACRRAAIGWDRSRRGPRS